jgi:four helix bundle protein
LAERFEELEVWRRSRQLTADVYRITARGELRRDFGLKDQMQRAAVSVMSNVAEGFERKSRRDFAHFLVMAKASAGELRSQLYVAIDADLADPGRFKRCKPNSRRSLGC